MYKVKIHKKVIKFLKSCTASEQKIIHSKIDLLKSDPLKTIILILKKLKVSKNYIDYGFEKSE